MSKPTTALPPLEEWGAMFDVSANILKNPHDKTIAKDVVSLFMNLISDRKNNIEGYFGGKIAIEISDNEKNDVYAVTIGEIVQVSLDSVQKITTHESVQDIKFEVNPATLRIQACIYLFKAESTKEKTPLAHVAPEQYIIKSNANMHGLIVSAQSKVVAKRIIEHVINMESEMWAPNWSNRVSEDGEEFMLTAAPFAMFPLSFYTFLCYAEPGVINNVILRAGLPEKKESGFSVSILCKTQKADRDDDADWIDEKPAVRETNTGLRGTKKTSHSIRKSTGFFESAKRMLFGERFGK